jgi:hypothetical protein
VGGLVCCSDVWQRGRVPGMTGHWALGTGRCAALHRSHGPTLMRISHHLSTAAAQQRPRDHTSWLPGCFCRVFVALVQKGRPGGRYLAAGEPMLVSQFFAQYCRLAGRQVPEGARACACAHGD